MLVIKQDTVVKLLEAINFTTAPYEEYDEDTVKEEYPWIHELIVAREEFYTKNDLTIKDFET